jgi:hypothetical protein
MALALLRKPVFICVIIMAGIESLLQNSFLAFASLFLEYQYRLASGSASLMIGFLSIPPLMIGGMLSGIITKKMKDKPTSCLKFLAGVLFVNLIVYCGFLVYCKEPTLISQRTMSVVSHDLPFSVSDNCDCNASACCTGQESAGQESRREEGACQEIANQKGCSEKGTSNKGFAEKEFSTACTD